MALVAELEVFLAAGNICPVDLTRLYRHCASLILEVGELVHKIDVQPQHIYVTPTKPVANISSTSTTSCSEGETSATDLPLPSTIPSLPKVKVPSLAPALPSSFKPPVENVELPTSTKSRDTPDVLPTLPAAISNPGLPAVSLSGPKFPIWNPFTWNPWAGLGGGEVTKTKTGLTGSITAIPVDQPILPLEGVQTKASTTKTGLTGSVPAIPIDLPKPPATGAVVDAATTKSGLTGRVSATPVNLPNAPIAAGNEKAPTSTKSGVTTSASATPVNIPFPPLVDLQNKPSTTKTGLTGSVPAIPINFPHVPVASVKEKVATTSSADQIQVSVAVGLPTTHASLPSLAPFAPSLPAAVAPPKPPVLSAPAIVAPPKAPVLSAPAIVAPPKAPVLSVPAVAAPEPSLSLEPLPLTAPALTPVSLPPAPPAPWTESPPAVEPLPKVPVSPPAPYVAPGPPAVKGSPGSSCKSGSFVSIAIDLAGLNIDVDLYLNLCGLLDSVGNLLSGLLHGTSRKPTSVTREYRTHCGESFAKYPGSLTTTAHGAKDCLVRCEHHAIHDSVNGDTLRDCLGASYEHGADDSNCRYWIGSDSDMLDANPNVITHDNRFDSYCK